MFLSLAQVSEKTRGFDLAQPECCNRPLKCPGPVCRSVHSIYDPSETRSTHLMPTERFTRPETLSREPLGLYIGYQDVFLNNSNAPSVVSRRIGYHTLDRLVL
jgi:hypothetical protein